MTALKATELQGEENEMKMNPGNDSEYKKSGTERKMKCNIFMEREIEQ